ncbi:hypothetical protein QAD02_019127 [Eretmocerus hayati]|uniref:Uncharacterized protein n=1 Tax=Eretmocerus hayati TaxID=131215 RepID=A0ACC2PIB7_9HYME|nr:hypothetical protein QAD02_019127 [Eretmocerus hayati]
MSDDFESASNHSSSSDAQDENYLSSSTSDSDDSLSSGAMSVLFDDDESDGSDRPKRKERACFQNYCDETVQKYSDKKFVRMFRLPRDIVNTLIKEFANSEYFQSEDSRGLPKIPPHQQMYCFLYFVGHQAATYEETTDRFDLSADTVFNIITRVADFIGSYAPDLITWPTEEESQETQAYYEEKNGIPGVEGMIDGSEIKINKPPSDAESYYNRKGFYSIKLQIICDHKRRIRHFHAGWPGSVHDARMYKNSGVPGILARKNTTYPCTKHLMPPYKDNGHLLPHQKLFNKQLSKCRVCVEHTIGLLKQRFRILYHMRLQPGMRRLKVIRACIVLHNMALMRDVNFLEAQLEGCSCQQCRIEAHVEPEFSDGSENDDDADDLDGLQLRDQVANTFRN